MRRQAGEAWRKAGKKKIKGVWQIGFWGGERNLPGTKENRFYKDTEASIVIFRGHPTCQMHYCILTKI
ncbi:MAG: hypothetical protein ACTTJZ_00940 [Sphaerochaetaceae bacterium]